jgi:hypothetical protein
MPRRGLPRVAKVRHAWLSMPQRQVQMNRILTAVGALLIAFLIFAEFYLLTHYWDIISTSTQYDKVAPLIAALFTPAVATLTIVFSYLVINRQFHVNEEIEKIKHRLGERYKRESDAYFKIWDAVAASYRKLSDLETGTKPPLLGETIESKFADAESYSFVTPQDHERLFYSYWQAARELAAKADKAGTAEEIKKLWADNARSLAEKRSAIRDQFREKYLGSET